MDTLSRSLVFLTALFAIGVFARQVASEPTSPKDYTLRSDVRMVSLDVSVQDASGSYVGGLTLHSFELYDNGKQQALKRFSTSDSPVTVGLLVDNSGSMRAKRNEVVTAGLLFAKSSNPNDEFFVINFNDHVYSALPPNLDFTDKLQILRSALFFGEPKGRTALYDALASGIDHLELGHHDMRVLVVVSDGGDNASKTKLADLLRRLDRSQDVVYCVGLLNPEERDLNPHVLRKISTVSGGSLFLPASIADISAVFEKISVDIRNRYSLGFTPAMDRKGAHTLRLLAHDAQGRKLIVHSRTSYYVGD